MNEFAQTLYNELTEDLELIHDLGDLPVRRLTAAVSAIAAATKKLRTHIEETPPVDHLEEIDLFKNWKSKFASEQYYALEKFTIENNLPLTDPALLKTYYEQELLFISRFFSQHEFLYQYYKFEFAELDQVLFLRGNNTSNIILPETADLDPEFSTKGDHLFAKFIAYEKLREYLMDCLYGKERTDGPFRSKKGRQLAWTGDKSNLVEMAYAIHDTMQINNGEVDISDIIDWLEQSLQVNLGRYYKRFSEIRMRKNISRTRYLDYMREMILKHMEEGDTFKPQPLKPVSGSKSRS